MHNSKCCGGGCFLHKTCGFLLFVGGLNWGLVGVALLLGSGSNWNVINLLLGSWPVAEGIVYVLVGIAALMKIFGRRCRKCMEACACCNDKNTDQKM